MSILRFSHGLCAPLLAMGSLVVLAGCSSQAAAPLPPRPAIVVHPTPGAEVGDVFSGDVHARFESRLGFRVAGKIQHRLVDVGAHVEAGQVLAELDPVDLKLQADSARADLASARASRDLARNDFERYRALLEKHYISQTQFDSQANALKAAQARVDQAAAALAVARNQAGYSTLRADHAGTITAIDAEAGQVVAAGQPIATLARDGAIEVEIAVPENRVAAFRIGQAATIQAWADANRQLHGRLREIGAEADPVTRTYHVRVSVLDTSSALRLGQSARVYFADASGQSLTRVPLSALGHENGNAVVWLLDPRTHAVHAHAVTVTAFREHGALVGPPLSATQWIVAAGIHKLREGQTIAPVDTLNRPLEL